MKPTSRTTFIEGGHLKDLNRQLHLLEEHLLNVIHFNNDVFDENDVFCDPIHPFCVLGSSLLNDDEWYPLDLNNIEESIGEIFESICNEGFNVTGYILYNEDEIYIIGLVDITNYNEIETGKGTIYEFWDVNVNAFGTVVLQEMTSDKIDFLYSRAKCFDKNTPEYNEIQEQIENLFTSIR